MRETLDGFQGGLQIGYSFRMNYWSRWIHSRTVGSWLQKMVSATEFRTRINSAGDRGITAENMEKSQHTDFNEDTVNESVSVGCSNVRLWKLDSLKEWRNTSWRLWDERRERERDSAGFVDSKENKAEVKRKLLDTVKARKLAYYGHTMRKQRSFKGQHRDMHRTPRRRVSQNDRGQR